MMINTTLIHIIVIFALLVNNAIAGFPIYPRCYPGTAPNTYSKYTKRAGQTCGFAGTYSGNYKYWGGCMRQNGSEEDCSGSTVSQAIQNCWAACDASECCKAFSIITFSDGTAWGRLVPEVIATRYEYNWDCWAPPDCYPQNCSAGYYSAGGAARQCKNCEAGQYSSSGASECSDCYAGQHSLAFANECIRCGPGFYSPNDRAGWCTICNAGFHSNGYTNAQCHECNPGRVQAWSGASSCDPCPAGKYSHTNQGCYDCSPGEYSESAASNCSDCPTGEYSYAWASSGCIGCQAGYYAPPQNPTYCDNCVPGKYSYEKAAECSECSAGYFSGHYYATECEGCKAGTYSHDNSGGCNRCYAGKYSHDFAKYECEKCNAGWFQPFDDAKECIPCEAGKYVPWKEATYCSDCSPGSYCFEGANAQMPCPAGYYCPNVDQGPKLCSAGYYSLGEATECQSCGTNSSNFDAYLCGNMGSTEKKKCPAGFYCTDSKTSSPCDIGYFCPEGTHTQVPCPVGTYNPSTKADSCISCSAGTYCLATGSDKEIPCPAGSYCSSVLHGPKLCSAGYYSLGEATECQSCGTNSSNFDAHLCDNMGSTEKKKCPAGFYCTDTKTSSPCDIGYFCPEGTHTQVPCPVGTYNPSTKADSCLKCAAGKYNGGTASKSEIACQLCQTGRYSSEPGQSSCQDCEAGKFCSKGSSESIHCSARKYCPHATYSELDCYEGYYCSEGSTEPTRCSMGSYCPEKADSEIDCPPGFYCPTPSLKLSCENVDQGVAYYCRKGSTTLEQCPSGFICPNSTIIRSCYVDDKAHFCPQGNAFTSLGQAICPKGYYCPKISLKKSCIWDILTQDEELISGSHEWYCPEGSYKPIICPDAKTCDGINSYDCAVGYRCKDGRMYVCKEDEYCPLGSKDAVLCPVGHYCENGEKYSCGTNSNGKAVYCPEGSTSPSMCAIGHECNDTLQQVKCGSGFYCDTGTMYQSICPPGFYCPTPSLKLSCENVDQGVAYYCEEGSTTLERCPSGFICPNSTVKEICQTEYCPEGQFEPVVCPSSFHCDNRFKYLCDDIDDGNAYFCPAGQNKPIVCSEGFYCPTTRSQKTCIWNDSNGDNVLVSENHTWHCPKGSKIPKECPESYICPNPTTIISCYAEDDEAHFCPKGNAFTSLGQTICPKGYYCPKISLKKSCIWDILTQDEELISGSHEWYCPESSYKPIICPDAKTCDGINSYDCAVGYRCKDGRMYVCKEDEYCPLGSKDAVLCPVGHYCENGEKYSCGTNSNGKAVYCPEGSTRKRKCISGYYCPDTTVEIKCENDGSYCPEGTQTPIECPRGSYCEDPAIMRSCEWDSDISDDAEIQKQIKKLKSEDYASFCPGGNVTPDGCPKGFYCHRKGKFKYRCDKDEDPDDPIDSKTSLDLDNIAYFCPKGSIVAKKCLEGHACSNSKVQAPCSSSSYCPEGSFGDDGKKITEFSIYAKMGDSNKRDRRLSTSACNAEGVEEWKSEWIAQCKSVPDVFNCFWESCDVSSGNHNFVIIVKTDTEEDVISDETLASELSDKVDDAEIVVDSSTEISSSMECAAGFYCTTASMKKSCVWDALKPDVNLESAYTGWYCPRKSRSPLKCPAGFYCERGRFKYSCDDPASDSPVDPTNPITDSDTVSYYCPEGSIDAKKCPAGSFCPNSKTRIKCDPLSTTDNATYCAAGVFEKSTCPSNFKCETSAVKVACSGNEFCGKGSQIPTTCPGKILKLGENTHSRCECPFGYFSHLIPLKDERLGKTKNFETTLDLSRFNVTTLIDIPIEKLHERETLQLHCEKCPTGAFCSSCSALGNIIDDDFKGNTTDRDHCVEGLSLMTYEKKRKISLKPGYWQTWKEVRSKPSSFSLNGPIDCGIYIVPKSKSKSICIGGDNWKACAEGHTGPLCGLCCSETKYLLCIENSCEDETNEACKEQCKEKWHHGCKDNNDWELGHYGSPKCIDCSDIDGSYYWPLLGIFVGGIVYMIFCIVMMAEIDPTTFSDMAEQKKANLRDKLKRALNNASTSEEKENVVLTMKRLRKNSMKNPVSERVKRRRVHRTRLKLTSKRDIFTSKQSRKEHYAFQRAIVSRKAHYVIELFSVMRILVSHIQILSQLKYTAGIAFPSNFESFYSELFFINFDIVKIAAHFYPCQFATNFVDQFYAHMSLIPVLFFVLFLSYGTTCIIVKCSQKRIKFTCMSAKMHGLRIMWFILYIMYPGVAVKCFRCFNCIDVNDKSYLSADISIECVGDEYNALLTASAIFTGIYVVGIPLLCFLVLYRWKSWLIAEHHMSDEMYDAMTKNKDLRSIFQKVATAYGAVFLSYRPSTWWYEPIELTRKALMTGMLVALPDGATRSSVGVFVAAISLSFCAGVRPYDNSNVYRLQLLLMLMLFMTYFVNLLIFTNVLSYTEDYLGNILIGGNVVVLVCGALLCVYMLPPIRSCLESCQGRHQTLIEYNEEEEEEYRNIGFSKRNIRLDHKKIHPAPIVPYAIKANEYTNAEQGQMPDNEISNITTNKAEDTGNTDLFSSDAELKHLTAVYRKRFHEALSGASTNNNNKQHNAGGSMWM